MNPNFFPTYDDNFQHLLTTSKLHTNGKHIKIGPTGDQTGGGKTLMITLTCQQSMYFSSHFLFCINLSSWTTTSCGILKVIK
jgi:hypothetical protein